MRTTKIRRRITSIGAAVALMSVPIAALAGSVFNDVDDTSTHIEGITWVKDSGVSVGCDNNGNYCPDDDVTRAQMATFMHRLSGNDPSTARSVDADEVDGFDANQLVRVAYDQVDDDALVGTAGIALSATMEAPGAGFLIVSASSDVYGTASDVLSCQIEVNGDVLSASMRTIELDFPDNSEDNCSTDAVYVTLSSGTFLVDLVYPVVAAGTIVDESVLTVMYVPFNGEGGRPSLPIVLLGTTDGN